MSLPRQLIFVTACLTVVAGTASPASAQTQQEIDWCVNKGLAFAPDLIIRGCTALIKSGRLSGRGLAEAFSNRGAAYYTKKDYNRAIAEFSEAIRLDPNFINAIRNRGLAYDNKNDYDQALANFNEAIRLDPKNASFYRERGLIYSHKRDYDRAIADYSEAIRLKPNYADAFGNRGDAYHDKGDTARANADYQAESRLEAK